MGCRPHERAWLVHAYIAKGVYQFSTTEAVVVGASTHDSQVAIPLMQMSAQRVTDLYGLMASAYDAEAIHAFSRSLGHVPIIDLVLRGDWIPLDEAQRQRFGQVEQVQQTVHPLPRHPLGVAPSSQPFPPYSYHFPPIPRQGFVVARDAEIPKVTFEFPTQGFHLHP